MPLMPCDLSPARIAQLVASARVPRQERVVIVHRQAGREGPPRQDPEVVDAPEYIDAPPPASSATSSTPTRRRGSVSKRQCTLLRGPAATRRRRYDSSTHARARRGSPRSGSSPPHRRSLRKTESSCGDITTTAARRSPPAVRADEPRIPRRGSPVSRFEPQRPGHEALRPRDESLRSSDEQRASRIETLVSRLRRSSRGLRHASRERAIHPWIGGAALERGVSTRVSAAQSRLRCLNPRFPRPKSAAV